MTRLCELWDTYTAAMAAMMSDGGPAVESRSRRIEMKGRMLAHPLLAPIRNLSEQMERLEADLGLNPVDRARIRVGKPDKGSSLDEWQKRRASRPEAPDRASA